MRLRDDTRESDAFYYVTPPPGLVVQIVDRYGAHAAAERWGWLSLRQLTDLYRQGSGNAEATLRLAGAWW